jgi:hypothetical protein
VGVGGVYWAKLYEVEQKAQKYRQKQPVAVVLIEICLKRLLLDESL